MPGKTNKNTNSLKIRDRDKYKDPDSMFALRAAKASRKARKKSSAFQGVKKVSQ
tara:strand:+ start:308 stop:469 length:162 start_codon:yes stop_codon:yes gene_type:complete